MILQTKIERLLLYIYTKIFSMIFFMKFLFIYFTEFPNLMLLDIDRRLAVEFFTRFEILKYISGATTIVLCFV